MTRLGQNGNFKDGESWAERYAMDAMELSSKSLARLAKTVKVWGSGEDDRSAWIYLSFVFFNWKSLTT
jgi:hypothetical protein